MNTTQPNSTNQLSLAASLRTLPRPAWILFFGTFLNKFGTFVIPFLTLYLLRQGYTLADAGLTIGAYGVGHLLASVLGGHLADTLGRRKTIVLSMFSGGAAMLMLSQARGLPMIMLLTMLAGLTGELYRPASSALLADLVPTGQRVTAFSAYRIAFNAGWAFGPATAGFLAQRGYFWLFVGDAATSILYGVLAYFALPRGVHHRQTEASWKEGLSIIRQDRRFHQVLLAAGAAAVVFFQMASTFGVYVTNLGFSPAVYGAIISLNGALVVLCELPMTTLTRRFPARRVMAVGYVLLGTGFALIAFAHTIATLVLCVVILTVGEMVALPVAVAYIADLAPIHMRGRYMGLHALTWAMALIFGPAIGMRLLGINHALVWLCGGGLCVIASTIILSPVGQSLREDVITPATE